MARYSIVALLSNSLINDVYVAWIVTLQCSNGVAYVVSYSNVAFTFFPYEWIMTETTLVWVGWNFVAVANVALLQDVACHNVK
jgi:hypothetical protein